MTINAKTLVLAAAAALMTAPAFAQVPSGALGAIAHFNQDHSSQDQFVSVVEGKGTGVSTRSGNSSVQARFNADFDSQDNARNVTGATIVSGAPANSGDIFARIFAESAENE